MNADPIEEIRKTLVLLRQNPTTKKRFPSEIWDAIIQLTKTHSHEEICQQLQIAPGLLKRKIGQRTASMELHEISLNNISQDLLLLLCILQEYRFLQESYQKLIQHVYVLTYHPSILGKD